MSPFSRLRLAGCFPGLLPFAAGAVAAVLLTFAPPARAHGDDLKLIEALTEELAKTPDTDLHIRRGELYRHHEEWALAEADFLAAAKLDPNLFILDFFLARLHLSARAPDKALFFLERYLQRAPDEPEAWFLRGDISVARGDYLPAAAAYAEGIRRTSTPRPEHFLRRAQFLAATPHVDKPGALACLEEGIARLGPVITLVDYALQLEVEDARWEAALARLARTMENMPRRERWLVRQGDILVKAGRPRDAVASYRAALTAIEELPERYRDTVPMEKLAIDIRAALVRLSP